LIFQNDGHFLTEFTQLYLTPKIFLMGSSLALA
jgi:hypothetical protein